MHRRSFLKKAQLAAAGLLCAVTFSGIAAAQGYRYLPEHRRPVDATLRDLNGISSHSIYNRHERERYDTAMRHLEQFAERLHDGGFFDKGKLDQAIGDVQSVLNHNKMSNRAHDVLARDVSELREMRRRFDNRNRYER